MTAKEKAPAAQGVQGAVSYVQKQDKDTIKSARIQNKVLELLRAGESLTVVEMTTILHISDPRGHIRDLRRKGYPIADYWCTTKYGNRYKRYFLKEHK